ncbi:MAG: hypothetical protein RJA99_3315 [Pseudomonadota bacterium]
MQIGTQQQSVCDVMSVWSAIGQDMGCLERFGQIASGNGTATVIGCHQTTAKSRLTQPLRDGSKHTGPHIDTCRLSERRVRRGILCGLVNLLVGDGSQRQPGSGCTRPERKELAGILRNGASC